MLRIRLGFWNGNLSRRFYASKVKDAKFVRKEFLDYFETNRHEFVRSSPVVPYNDPTTPFVNAGMNQFKGVLLGLNDPPALRVANSQKCIRVGGKHNDIDVVGSDTYHHTFFEMLGNWSFGDYFKKEACEYAWNLLTGPFGIKKEFLYVTYFKGDEQLGIGPDLECKEIWKQLGVPSDRILPFGTKDNFWEMGLTGPCGPCTEIHIDHAKLPTNQSDRVNKGHADLTELWNIVFIQHERLPDGSITSLPKHHVDTGMGFERLLAVIQNKRSNYDTDLFQDLFLAIENFAKVPKYEGRFGSADKNGMDTGYRLLADHARMITVALSDGIIPDQNPKLRRVLRKAINVSENIFHKNGLLNELSYRVVESLGDTYPELEKNINKVRSIIHYEEDILKSLRGKTESEWAKIVKNRPQLAAISEVTPGLIPAYKELQTQLKSDSNLNTISGEVSYRLYDTYGLNVETISELAKLESLSFDIEEFKKELDKMQELSRLKNAKTTKNLISESVLDVLIRSNVPKTNDSYKYVYSYDNEYKFPPVTCKLLDIIVEDNLLSQSGLQIFDESQLIVEATVAQSGNVVQREAIINPTTEVAILLDETPCYASEGGQAPDRGYIFINKLLFAIKEVRKIRDYVFHIGHFVIKDENNAEFEVQVGDECTVMIDESKRLGLMQHHTATHLLNAALKTILPVSGQRGSFVSNDSLSYECSIFGNKLNPEDAKKIEQLVNDTIKAKVPVQTKTIDMLRLLAADDVVTIPGEIYPDDKIRIVEIDGGDLKSKEACCGTHVLNTSHLDYFCILNIKSEGRVSCSIKAAVGPLAEQAKIAGENFANKLSNMENEFLNNTNSVHKKIFNKLLHEIKVQLKGKNSKTPVSYVDVQSCMKRIEELQKAVELKEKEAIRKSIEAEMKKVLQSSALPFVVHYVRPNDGTLDSFPLPKITKLYANIPVFIIAYSQGTVEARCCVPKEKISDKFNAESWMRTVLPILNSQSTNTSNKEICNMKTKKISNTEMKVLVDKCIAEASKFASLHLKETEE